MICGFRLQVEDERPPGRLLRKTGNVSFSPLPALQRCRRPANSNKNVGFEAEMLRARRAAPGLCLASTGPRDPPAGRSALVTIEPFLRICRSVTCCRQDCLAPKPASATKTAVFIPVFAIRRSARPPGCGVPLAQESSTAPAVVACRETLERNPDHAHIRPNGMKVNRIERVKR
jgi:hypothetical protein